MRTRAVGILGMTFTLIGTNYAQTYTACDPTNVTCQPTPGLDSSYYFIDFTKVTSTPIDWVVPTWCRVTYNTKGRTNGAELEFLERYDSQQLYSSFYFLFGRVEFVVQAAPGPGIISDMMTLSDDLDELDWEFRGSLDDEVQTGWFGKGVTGLYNHSITPKIPTPMTQFHTYAFDWTPERVIWEDDGAVVRTLQASDCIGTANQYPQTPMKAMIGLWDAGDPDHYDPWAAGMTPVPPPAGGYSFYVKSVKIWNNNPAACYNWSDHSGSWQSIKAINDTSVCGVSPKSSSLVVPSSSATSSSATILSSSLSTSSSLVVMSSSSVSSPSSKTTMSSSVVMSSSSVSSLSSKTTMSSTAISSSSRLVFSPSASSSSSTIASLPLELSLSHPLASNSFMSLILSSGSISMTLSAPTPLSTTRAIPSIVSTKQAISNTLALNTLASSTISSDTYPSSAQFLGSSSSTIHISSIQPSGAHPPSTSSGITQLSSTSSSGVSSLTSVKGLTHISATASSGLLLSSLKSNALPASQSSGSESFKSTSIMNPTIRSSATAQTLTGRASTSSSTKAASLTGVTGTTSMASPMVSRTLSAQTETSSKFAASISKGAVIVSSTGVVNVSPTASPGTFPMTTGSIKNSLFHPPVVPWRNTLTIVVELPGHQTLSYNPIVEDLTELIVSLENLMHGYRSKRDLGPASSEPDGSDSQPILSDPNNHRHQHGHQHDHLHYQNRARGIGNSDHTALTSEKSASVASGPFPFFNTTAAAMGGEQNTAIETGTSGAASLSDHSTFQSNANAPTLADDQESSRKGAPSETVVPKSFLEDESAVAQATATYSGTATSAGTQALLHQKFSSAQRVPPKSGLGLYAIILGLWVFCL